MRFRTSSAERRAAAALVLALAARGAAQECPTTAAAADTAAGDSFGRACALDDDVLVAGTFPGNGGGGAGAAYLFDVGSMTELRKITEPGSPAFTAFGQSVAIDGDTVVVGAPGAAGAGAIYVFDAATGAQRHRITPPDTEVGDTFGDAVAVSGRFALVGGRFRDDADDDSGRAWLVDVESGQVVAVFRPTRGGRGSDEFGASVAISGDTGLVGAPKDDTFGTNTGAVYVVDVARRRVVRKLFAEGTPVGAHFGEAVAVHGAFAAVGAFLEDSVAADAGAVYTYDVPSFSFRRRFTLDEGGPGDFFGQRVAVRDGVLAARAALNQRRSGAGAAYVFDVRTGERLSTLPADGRAIFDNFGAGLAIDDERLVCGAPGDDDRGQDAGEVQIFRLDELPDTPIVFDPEPETSIVHVEITIPGIGSFSFDVRVTGRMLVVAPLDCDPPKSFRTTGLELRPADPAGNEVVVLPGVSGRVFEPVVTLAAPGAGGAVAPDGTFAETLTIRLAGVVMSTTPLGDTLYDLSRNPDLPVAVSGRVVPGSSPLRLELGIPEATSPIDLGFGPFNPSITVSGAIALTRRPGRAVPATPHQVRSARVGLVFTAPDADSARLAGTFDRLVGPGAGPADAVLRIGASRIDVQLVPRGSSGLATPAGAAAAIKLKTSRKSGKFKVKVARRALAAALAAEPSEESLPAAFSWSLTLADGWNMGGTVALDGKRRVASDAEGAVTRASLAASPPPR